MPVGPGGGGVDPVQNISPEQSAAGQHYSQRYEDLFMMGKNLWDKMKDAGEAKKKLYFVGSNGNSGDEIAESVLDSLAYIPSPDGTYMIHRKPNIEYPKIIYDLITMDKRIGEKSRISPVDLFMDDEKAYRDLEVDILKEFHEKEYTGYPAGIVVSEGAALREEAIEIMKQGIVIWIDADPEFTWMKTQYRPKQGAGLYTPPDYSKRPPVWCIANGWDGDMDDTEGKLEYVKVTQTHRKIYEQISDLRLRSDIPGIGENSYWGAERLVKALGEYLGYNNPTEQSVEEEVMEKDLEKFLEGARLSKYLKPALDWCEEQGAASLEDIVENIPDISEALKLKPLEKKRLEKAAASVEMA